MTSIRQMGGQQYTGSLVAVGSEVTDGVAPGGPDCCELLLGLAVENTENWFRVEEIDNEPFREELISAKQLGEK